MKIKIYIKNIKKPIVAVSDDDDLLEMLYRKLNNNEIDIIKVGPIIFKKEDFILAVEEGK